MSKTVIRSCAGELAFGFYQTGAKRFKKLAAAGLKRQAEELLRILAENPFQNPPPYEKLVGDLAGAYSPRLNVRYSRG